MARRYLYENLETVKRDEAMALQATNKPVSRKTSPKPAAKPNAPKLGALARTARVTGRVAGRAGARVAQPILQSIGQQQPQTLAKMALALLAPRLAGYALKVALRNPLLTIAGVVLVAALANNGEEAGAA